MIFCIAGNFQEENFRKFSGYVTIREIFLREIWGVVSFGTAQASNLQKYSPWKLFFSPICKSFLPHKFPMHYTDIIIGRSGHWLLLFLQLDL